MGACLGTSVDETNSLARSNFRKTSLKGSQGPGKDSTLSASDVASTNNVGVNVLEDFASTEKTVKVYPNGDTYEGTLKGDKRDGKGLLLHANHDMYEGGFKDDLRHGEGTFTYNDNGDVYSGDYLNNKRHGKGKYSWSTGDSYDGEWKENKKFGEGVMTYNDGDVYTGTWKDNKRHGNGSMAYSNGDLYLGEWFEGIKHGRGKMRWKNGESFDGSYANDKKHGEGHFVKINGDVEEVIFVNDVMTTTSASPKSKSTSGGLFGSPIGKLQEDHEYDPFVDRNHDELLVEVEEKRKSLSERVSISLSPDTLSIGSGGGEAGDE